MMIHTSVLEMGSTSFRLLKTMMMIIAFLGKLSDAAGAGRAFPVASENYVIQQFQSINPKLEWDPTNFLVDLSGQYANCRLIGSRGEVNVDRLTQEGNTIVGYVDYTDGSNVDVNSVNGYLKRTVDRWMKEQNLHYYVRSADRFGCSVRPGCVDRVVVSCLFSGYEPQKIEPGKQKALAFTPEQYQFAERITSSRWDRTHFLENLSGFETDCAMIGNDDWPFTTAHTAATAANMRLIDSYGYEPNYGSTPDALEKILRKMKRVSRAKGVGCSLIPDCIRDDQMYVVVSCLYEEY